jgi:type IV pilus assembly protein PilV
MRALNTGVGLVETLVALLVFSIGMLGIARMFVTSLANSRSALLRTQAINLVSDMVGRIRANAMGRAAYEFAAYAGGPQQRGCMPTSAPGSGGNCTEAQLAEDDLARWQDAVQALLPASSAGVPAASVQYFAGAPDRYRIAVAWQEPNDAQPSTHQAEILAQVVP